MQSVSEWVSRNQEKYRNSFANVKHEQGFFRCPFADFKEKRSFGMLARKMRYKNAKQLECMADTLPPGAASMR